MVITMYDYRFYFHYRDNGNELSTIATIAQPPLFDLESVHTLVFENQTELISR